MARRWNIKEVILDNFLGQNGSLPLKLLSSQSFVSLQVFGGRFGNDIRWQHQTRWSLVPIERFEVIADELLVKTGLALARLVLIRRPEARGIGSQHLINQDEFSLEQTEF